MSSEPSPSPAAARLVALDALRGFNMFLILGAGTILVQLDRIVNSSQHVHSGLLRLLAEQMKHKDWEGFAFEDLIFPLFVFIMGASLVFSLTKELRLHGRLGAYRRIFRRAVLLFAFGVFATGGLSEPWPSVQFSGVLHRLAWCYLFASLFFCHLRAPGIAASAICLLAAYWALLAFVPIPNVRFEGRDPGRPNVPPSTRQVDGLIAKAKGEVQGSYEKGLNLTNYLDARYLPGRKNDVAFSNEGLLSTMGAVASCLLGVLAGLLLQAGVSPARKVNFLFFTGVAGVGLGFLWGLELPVIKKIWTPSYVLVAGGYSALLLAAFYQVVEVWRWQRWCAPLVWIGMNSITIYMLKVARIVDFNELARRFVGGDVARLASRWLPGSAELIATLVSFGLMLLVVRFLYVRKIFLRL